MKCFRPCNSSVKHSILTCCQVSEAIKIGAQAIKENRISVEEVQDSLQEIEESIDTLKQLENVIGNFLFIRNFKTKVVFELVACSIYLGGKYWW